MEISKILSNASTNQGVPNPYGQNYLCLNQFNSMAKHTQHLINDTATRTVQGGLNAIGCIYDGLTVFSSQNKATIHAKFHVFLSNIICYCFCIYVCHKFHGYEIC